MMVSWAKNGESGKKKKKRSGSGYILKLTGLDDRMGWEKERNQERHQRFWYDNWNY